MKRFTTLILALSLACDFCRADGRAGVVEWSDGHKQSGDISLTEGKGLRVFTSAAQVSLALDQVEEIRFSPEKEEMWEGFYFPNAGQATQVKTGEVYPVRYLKAQVTLGSGQVVEGHLNTTVFYIEDDNGAQKIVVLAKQTGANGEKLADLIYPTVIRFDAGTTSTASARIDLTQAGLAGIRPPVIITRPDLSFVSAQQAQGQPVWTVATDDPAKLFFSVEAADGIHVAWPDAPPDPAMQAAAQKGLDVMRDFYDSRTMLACATDPAAGDIDTLVMLKRLAKSVDGGGTPTPAGVIPWSLVILRWKYDPDLKKATLLNRALLKIGRQDNQTPLPKVSVEPALLRDVAASK